MAASLVANVLASVIILGAIILFLLFMAKREERALTNERGKYSHEDIASHFSLWDKFVSYYADKGEEMTSEAFEALPMDERMRILSARFVK